MSPKDYRGDLWEWHKCHVRYRGTSHSVRAHGHFIRRYQFDDILLQRSGAEVTTHNVKRLERDADRWLVDDRFSARYLIGAGGTPLPRSAQIVSAQGRAPSTTTRTRPAPITARMTSVERALHRNQYKNLHRQFNQSSTKQSKPPPAKPAPN